MAMDRERGVTGTATDRLRETTGVLRGESSWHSANSDVYHNNPKCKTGKSIEAGNRRQEAGGKRLCKECERLNVAAGPVGNLTNLR
jgi:hypothetical protein